ncbi:hypothetical protein ABZ705_00025 [Streptomyces sp. NPDC006984]|uniref:hypothetical protein n=1 Tax=Streptomyces sp. NPDC006984 TaxID=3155463 RepID=UPI0033E66F9B
MKKRSAARSALAGAVAVYALAAPPAPAGAAEGPGPGAYTFDTGAHHVSGASVNTKGPVLEAGSTYRDGIAPEDRRYYRIDLDDRVDAYLSAVAVPEPGSRVAYGDGLSVTIEDRSGRSCDSGTARFGSADYARPIADYAERRITGGRSTCQEAGPYYVLLERSGEQDSSPDPWQVEIRLVTEPRPATPVPTEAPEEWPSASPAAPAGGPTARAGGHGFHDATGLDQGEWQDEIAPGETLFYRVPVDWGQQLFVSADLGSSTEEGDGVGNALAVSLYNPARGLVDRESAVRYDGKQKSLSIDPLPPVAHENRHDSDSSVGAMRFAGWYYLSVTLSPETAQSFGDGPLPLTLRVDVSGEAGAGPGYEGPAGDFQVTSEDRSAADSGRNAAQESGGAMAVVAAAALGTGTLLVLGLGVWTLTARRRAARGTGAAGPPAQAAGAPPAPGPGPDDGYPGRYETPVHGHGGYGPPPAS